MKKALAILLLLALAAPRAPAATVPDCPPATEEKVLADFEDGKTEGWQTEYDVKMSVEESDKAHGKKWLNVELSGDNWPGARFVAPPGDWLAWRALRVSMYNPTDRVVQVSLRIDDVDSLDYQTRFNWERGINLRPGANQVEVSTAALRMGSGTSRGLDVGHITLVSFYRTFPGGPVPFRLDHLRLVPVDRSAPERRVLADFEKTGAVQWQLSDGVSAEIEKRPDGVDGSALKVAFPPKALFPRLTLRGFPGDWLSYDFLCLDVFCPKEGAIPRNLFLDVRTENWLSQSVCTGLEPGLNRLRVPVELVALPSLSNVRSLALYLDQPMKEQTIHVDNVRLERQPRVLLFGEAVHMDYETDDGLRINFRELELEGWSTSYGAVAFVPLATGETRMVRCSGRRGTAAGFTVPPEAFKGMKRDAPVEVWGYFRARNCTYFMRDEVRVKPGEPTTMSA